MSRTKTGFYSEKTGLKNGFNYEKNSFYSEKNGFYSEQGIDVKNLIFILKNWFLLFSSFLLKLKIYYL